MKQVRVVYYGSGTGGTLLHRRRTGNLLKLPASKLWCNFMQVSDFLYLTVPNRAAFYAFYIRCKFLVGYQKKILRRKKAWHTIKKLAQVSGRLDSQACVTPISSIWRRQASIYFAILTHSTVYDSFLNVTRRLRILLPAVTAWRVRAWCGIKICGFVGAFSPKNGKNPNK